MRVRRSHQGLTVNAIAGTHVVYLGVDLHGSRRRNCLGFAVLREDHTENEREWMRGTKTFRSVGPPPDAGVSVSSHQHPFQTFQWGDYSAKPDHDYTYTVVPMHGPATKLRDGKSVSVDVRTESEWGATHSVFFNRGAIASQEYARRFQNRKPSDVGAPAYDWLSRGLKEALLAFIARASDATCELHGAIYEFQWPEILDALRAAHVRGAKVTIIFDAIAGSSGPRDANRAAVMAAKIKGITAERTAGKLMHNKFIVLSRGGTPVSVWTGSTNVTENGIFGHSNVGHAVDDATIAGAYLGFWTELRANPATAAMKVWTGANNPAPPSPWSATITPVFSAHKGLAPLDWYASIAGSATKGLFMTFAFGMHEKFQAVYESADHSVLRFALMEKEGNGAGLAQGKIDIRRIRKLPNVVVAVGNNLKLNAFDRWLAERDAATSEANVRWVHTKYLLVDPLGAHPIVVTGSANFSEASTDTNDENMLVIQGDTRVADIYIGEFLRLHAHYAFREAVAIALANGETWNPSFLIEDDSWQTDYFDGGSPRCMKREYFAGEV